MLTMTEVLTQVIDINTLLPVILGAGGALFLSTVFKFVLALRASAEGREAVAIQNLERWRDDADQRADRCLHRLDNQRRATTYWQSYAGLLAHQLAAHGITVPQPNSPPPHEDD